MQIKDVKPKMGFIYLAKHGLNKHGLKTKNWSHLVGDQTVEREREGEKREREKKKKKKKRRREEEKERSSSNQKGMELILV